MRVKELKPVKQLIVVPATHQGPWFSKGRKEGAKWCRCSVLPPGGRLAANVTNGPLQESVNLSAFLSLWCPLPLPGPRPQLQHARESCHAFDRAVPFALNAQPFWRKFYLLQD